MGCQRVEVDKQRRSWISPQQGGFFEVWRKYGYRRGNEGEADEHHHGDESVHFNHSKVIVGAGEPQQMEYITEELVNDFGPA